MTMARSHTGSIWLDDEDRRGLVYLLGFACVGMVLPFTIYPVFAMKILCFGLFAYAYNILFGSLGMLSFGHAAFFGAASYVTAHTAKFWGLTPELAILLGTGVATFVGLVFGWLAIRRTGLYFSMITLALAQLLYFYAIQSKWTHSDDGIQSVPRGRLFGLVDLGPTLSMYYFVLVVFLIGFAIAYRATHSPFGEILKAIRDNETRATSLGYKAEHFKLLAFVLSAGLSGLAGATGAIVFQLASLSDLHFLNSADVLLMVLIGGTGTVVGPVVGAGIFISLQELLAPFGAWIKVATGVIFILLILTFRKGVVGSLIDTARSVRARRRTTPVAQPLPKPEAHLARGVD
jgi:branched-chain amino acid transport system permease protein